MSVGSCDPGAQGCKSSLWALLQPELQDRVTELALGLIESEARPNYLIVLSVLATYSFSGFALPSGCRGMCSALQGLLRKICAGERCLLVLFVVFIYSHLLNYFLYLPAPCCSLHFHGLIFPFILQLPLPVLLTATACISMHDLCTLRKNFTQTDVEVLY